MATLKLKDLKQTVDKLDDVAEAYRGLYEATSDGKQFKLVEIEGLEDTKGLKSALEKERADREALEKKAKDFEDVDLDEYRKFATMMANNKELALIKDGKVDELKALWSENLTKEHQKALKKVETDRDEKVKAALATASTYVAKVRDSALLSAAAEAGVHGGAFDDVLLLGRTVFEVDENGDVVLMRDGKVVVGKDGKSPMSPLEWLEQVREKKPHWWPASGSGSGASQQSSGAARGKVMKRSAFDQLQPHERRETVRSGVQIVD